jgi:hypothetical protein
MIFTKIYKTFKLYFSWIAFTAFLFILTNFLSSLELILIYIRDYDLAGILLTIGFTFFIGLLETIPAVFILAVLKTGIQTLINKDPAPVIRLLVLAWFALSWLNMAIAIFRKSLF